MTCANAILDTLAGGPATLKHLAERMDYSYPLITRYLKALIGQGTVVRIRHGLYGLTGQTYTPRPAGRPRNTESATECAAAFGIAPQRASVLIGRGLAWKEGSTWVRKHTRAGRPTS
jgi:hypothetical protein